MIESMIKQWFCAWDCVSITKMKLSQLDRFRTEHIRWTVSTDFGTRSRVQVPHSGVGETSSSHNVSLWFRFNMYFQRIRFNKFFPLKSWDIGWTFDCIESLGILWANYILKLASQLNRHPSTLSIRTHTMPIPKNSEPTSWINNILDFLSNITYCDEIDWIQKIPMAIDSIWFNGLNQMH